MFGKDTHQFQYNGHLKERRERNEIGRGTFCYILFIMKKEFKEMCKVHRCRIFCQAFWVCFKYLTQK